MSDFWNTVINGGDVGGRATDVGQIGMTILAEVTRAYGGDPDKVPTEVRNRFLKLAMALEIAEAELQAFATYMLEQVGTDET